MRSYLVSLRVPAMVAAFGAIALLSACEDKRVSKLEAGAGRDSVLNALASEHKNTSAAPDSMPNVYMKERYFVNSKNYEVLYYEPNNKRAGRDTVEYKKLTPIILIDGKMVGKGWDVYDSLVTADKLPAKQH